MSTPPSNSKSSPQNLTPTKLNVIPIFVAVCVCEMEAYHTHRKISGISVEILKSLPNYCTETLS